MDKIDIVANGRILENIDLLLGYVQGLVDLGHVPLGLAVAGAVAEDSVAVGGDQAVEGVPHHQELEVVGAPQLPPEVAAALGGEVTHNPGMHLDIGLGMAHDKNDFYL